MEEFLRYCTNQGLVNLTGQKLVDQDLNIIVQFAIRKKRCSILVLSNNQITPQGLSLMAPVLYDYSSLTHLNFSSNRLGDAGALILARALTKANRTLIKLVLGANEITDEGVLYLAEMLEFNRTLTVLGLQENRIGDRGVLLLSKVLKEKNNTLHELSLYSNPSITDRSVDPLIDMLLHNQSLQTCWLWNCQLSNNGRNRFETFQQSKPKIDLRF